MHEASLIKERLQTGGDVVCSFQNDGVGKRWGKKQKAICHRVVFLCNIRIITFEMRRCFKQIFGKSSLCVLACGA